ncbi:MAG: T9SS type A sorting domain-containing protein [Bacteroidia bacterium]|nr:T9SS type A sorting domain-containing protein [Bacteroidia bacterium]
MTGINYCIEAIAPIRINCAVSTHYHILYLLTHVPDYNNYCFDYNWVGACIEEVPDNVGGAIVLYIFDMDGHPPFWLHTGNPGACNSDADTYTFDYGENIYLIGGMGVFYYHCVNLGYPYYFYLKIESLDPPYESYEENFLSNTESLNIFSGFFNINTFCSQHGITLDEGKYKITLGAYDCEQFYDDNGNIVDHAYRSLNIKTMYIVECPYSRNITDDIYDSYIGQAESYIVANNYIETSEKVIYKAQDYIKLTAGFNAKVTGDGQFITSIGPCGVGCNDLKLLSASPYSDNYTINLAENLKIDSNNFIENFESEKNELSSEENTIIFPNPFNNNIQIINPYKNISINVFDISSYNVFSKEYLYKNKIDLDFSELASGTYFIKIISEENIITKKIIKM